MNTVAHRTFYEFKGAGIIGAVHICVEDISAFGASTSDAGRFIVVGGTQIFVSNTLEEIAAAIKQVTTENAARIEEPVE